MRTKCVDIHDSWRYYGSPDKKTALRHAIDDGYVEIELLLRKYSVADGVYESETESDMSSDDYTI